MESEGLSAGGLVAEQDKITVGRPKFADQIGWYFNRSRDTHDLQHILSGYGRDPLGEYCVLAFTHGQNPNFANIFIAYLGALNLKRKSPNGVPVFSAVREEHRRGKKMPRLMKQDISALLAEPLADARNRTKIGEPTQYNRFHAMCR